MARADDTEPIVSFPAAFLAAGPAAPASEAVRMALDLGVRRLLGSLPEARRGDVEGIHQVRVGTRRLRSDLSTFRPLLEPVWCESLRDELKWLGAKLGAVRDLDVLRERLEKDVGGDTEALGILFEALAADHARAHAALIEALKSLRFGELQSRLLNATRDPSLQVGPAGVPCAVALPPLAASAWEHLARAGRRLDARRDSPEVLHEVRIRAKRARYTAEVMARALGPGRGTLARAFARDAEAIQDVLGAFHDAIVSADRVRAVARGANNPMFLKAAVRLARREDQAALAAREIFPKLWRRLDRKKKRRWMKGG